MRFDTSTCFKIKHSNMIKVIINADDLGLNPVVNKTIDEALCNHYITSSTILANSEYLAEVKNIVLKHPNASFGVHLNITAGKSITENPVFNKYGIMDENGCFIMKQSFKVCPNANSELKGAIKAEWMKQVDLLLQYGICLSHVDGHHHCHTWYGLTDIFLEVMQYYHLTCARQRYVYPEKKNIKIVAKSLIGAICNRLRIKLYVRNNVLSKHFSDACYLYVYRNKLKQAGIKTPCYFCSYSDMARIIMASRLSIKDGTVIELMCHPGNERFAMEYEIIKSDIIGLRNNSKFQIISYMEL